MDNALGFIADVASIIALIVTFWVAYQVWRLHREYGLIYRVPDAVVRLRKAAQELSRLNNQDERNRQDLLVAIANMKAALESITRHIGKEEEAAYRSLVTRILEIEQSSSLNLNDLDRVYADALHLSERAEDLVADRKHRLNP